MPRIRLIYQYLLIVITIAMAIGSQPASGSIFGLPITIDICQKKPLKCVFFLPKKKFMEMTEKYESGKIKTVYYGKIKLVDVSSYRFFPGKDNIKVYIEGKLLKDPKFLDVLRKRASILTGVYYGKKVKANKNIGPKKKPAAIVKSQRSKKSPPDRGQRNTRKNTQKPTPAPSTRDDFNDALFQLESKKRTNKPAVQENSRYEYLEIEY